MEEHPDLGVTQLALLCRMKYPTCKNYLNCMEIFGWIICDKRIRITPEGYRILR